MGTKNDAKKSCNDVSKVLFEYTDANEVRFKWAPTCRYLILKIIESFSLVQSRMGFDIVFLELIIVCIQMH